MFIRLSIAALLLAITAKFPGVAKLTEFSRTENAAVLVYFRNANDIGVLRGGKLLPLSLETRLSTPVSCCDHRAVPALAHKGGHIAYVRLLSAQPHREAVSLYDLSTGKQEDVFDAPAIWAVSWSPMDDRLAVVAQTTPLSAFAGDSDLYVVDPSARRAAHVTRGPFVLQAVTYTVSPHTAPSWSPSGGKLAIEALRAGSGREDPTARAVAVFDLQTNAIRKLADGANPSWSPSADVIAYLDPAGSKCFTVHSDGAGQKELFAAQGGFFRTGRRAPIFFPVVWSPFGDQLLFHQWVDTDLVLDVYRFDLKTAKAAMIGRGELQVVDWRKDE